MMQNDLISRSALIEYINSRDFSKRFIQSKESIQGILITFINEQPTAYDVEKVVAELEEHIEYDTFDYYKEDPLINMSFEKLEDIICNGGKE